MAVFYIYMSNLKFLEPIVSAQEITRDIARREKAWRKSRGLTQADLAERSQVNIGAIRRFEQTGQVSFESFVRICQALDCEGELDGLFGKPAYRSTEDVIAAQREAADGAKRIRHR